MCATENDLIRDLHCILQARPDEVGQVPLQVGTATIQTLKVPAAQPLLPLDISFEELLEQLRTVPQCHAEPDGWFVWTGHAGDVFWSLNGQLTDDGRCLRMVELKGDCPPATLESLHAWLSPRQQPLMYQLPQLGLFFDAKNFEAYRSA